MKLRQLSGATVLRRKRAVKRKNSPTSTAGNAQAQEWTRETGKIIVVPVELPLTAHALLAAIASYHNKPSVGNYLLGLAMQDARAIGSALANEENGVLEEIFGTEGKEGA